MTEFPGQQDGERVQFIFRRRPSTMVRGFLLAAVILAITAWPLIYWRQSWGWYVLLAGALLAVWLVFHTWLRWYYSVYIVTNLRVQQQIQSGLFRKTTIDVYLDKVQNISYNISGLKGSLLGYGMIVMQTMAGDMVMTKINHCEEIYSRLSTAVRHAGGNPESGENEDYDENDD